MNTQLINSNNLKEKLKEIGENKSTPAEIQSWLDTAVHKHWLKALPQENFTGSVDEPWFKEKSKDTIFKQLVLTPVFVSEVQHLIDFIENNYKIVVDDTVQYKNLNKLSYLQAQTQAQQWLDRINKKASLKEDTDALTVVEQLTINGEVYTLYDLGSRQNLLREGKVMNNCISTYSEKTEEELTNRKFLSLRDSSNKSLVNIGLITTKENISEDERQDFINKQLERNIQKRKESLSTAEVYNQAEFDLFIKKNFEKRGFYMILMKSKKKIMNYYLFMKILLK